MSHHPDIHSYLHAARAADLRAQVRAADLRQTATAAPSTRNVMPVRTRLGWLLVEAGLRLLHPPTPPRPT